MRLFNFYFFRYKIADLTGEQFLKGVKQEKKKKEVDILVIDDDDFPFLDVLQTTYGFNIVQKADIDNLKDVEPYQIILCDIQGVGKQFMTSYGGAYLGSQIKANYPNKNVIIYTASTTSIDNQKYYQTVDNVLPKGTSIEDWVSALNESIDSLYDPVKIWYSIQERLFREKVATKDIAYLESEYVKAIKSGTEKSIEKLYQDSNNISEIFKEALALLVKLIITNI